MTRGDLIMKRLLSLLLTAALLALALPVLADGDTTDAQGSAEVVGDANSTSTDADSPATDASTDADSAVTDSDASNAVSYTHLDVYKRQVQSERTCQTAPYATSPCARRASAPCAPRIRICSVSP